uniref:LsmAD domain-containing protein n=1 Tax=Anopheles epiroticus TaxID=199890 RepID=A0A182P7D8_9DIPT
MHAATSHVGNVVQIQTLAGHTYEGVVLEMAYRVDVGPDQKPKIAVETFVDRLIFKPNDIVTIVAKDVDPEDATRDTFKTDTAISRCNGTNWLEDRVLEPWDESDLNGESLEHGLELDSNADGWDVNDMFLKNEQVYGVQSTFDQSLSGYTVQIQKKDSEEFKVQELEAEKIANEIENNPVYKERIDIENGDEEAAFAAVIRPNSSNVSPQPASAQHSTAGGTDKNSNSVSSNSSTSSSSGNVSSSIAASSNSNGNNNLASNTSNSTNNNTNTVQAMPSNTKYIVPAKRKPGQGGKLVRSTPPPLANSNNNNGGPSVVTAQQQQQQQPPPSPQALAHKNSYGQMMSQQQQQQQQPPPGGQQHGGGGGGGMVHPQYSMHPNQSPYGHAQHQQQQQPPPQHGQASVMNSNKMNGDGRGDMGGVPPGGGGSGNMNVNNNQKPLPQRTVRQYANAPAPVTFSEPPPSLNPQQMGGQMQPMSTKPPMHLTHPHHAVVPPHMPPPTVVPAEHVVIQQHPMAMPPPVQQQPPPPQQQQQGQVQAPPPQPQRTVVVRNRDMEIDNLRKFGQDFKLAPPQQQPPMPNVHQQPPPPAPQQQQQPPQGPPSHTVVVQQAPPPQQQQPEHSSPPSLDSSPPLVNSQQQQQGKMVVVPSPHNEPPPQQAPLNQQQNQASQTASGMVVVPAQLPNQPSHHGQQPPPVAQQQPPPQQQQQQQQGQQPPVVVGGGSPPQQQPQQQQSNHVGGAPPAGAPTTGPGSQNAVNNSVPAGGGVSNGNANGVGTPEGTATNGTTGGEQKPGTATKKPFTLNPAAKPFTPRSPSTPNPSRPHTPQTPGPATITQGSYQQSPHLLQQQFVMSYVVPSSFPAAQQHPQAAQQSRIRNGRQVPVGASQMQVAAATGQPLLAPSPLQMITSPYGPAIHAQPFQAAPPFHQQYRIYDTPQPGPLQYLAATPPSTTPSPGQPHQQYHPGPQPSPAGGGPPTYQAVHHQQPAPYPISVCPIVPQQVVPAIYQNIPSAPQQNHHQQNLHVMHVAQHPSAQ